MTPTGQGRGGTRAVIYCIVPRELAPKLHEPLRRHFRDDPAIRVIVERRAEEERRRGERRQAEAQPPAAERRRIRNVAGRRIGERRASVAKVSPPALPRKLERYAHRLAFLERLEPSTEALEDLDSARLVMRAQAGDSDAFGELYLRYFDRAYNYLNMLFGDRHRAEDATQQAFMKVLAALARFDPRRGSFRTWLFAVVRNQAIDELRRERRLKPCEPSELRAAGEQRADVQEPPLALDWISDPELLLLVQRLPLPQRQVLLMRYMLDLTHREIASVLGRSPDDVRKLQQRAQDFLRERLVALSRRLEGGRRPQRMLARRGHALIARRRRFALLDAPPGRDR